MANKNYIVNGRISLTTQQQKTATATVWTVFNPVLLNGEIGIEEGSPPQIKIGDGKTRWIDLPYLVTASGGGGSGTGYTIVTTSIGSNTTAGNAANTQYVYIVTASATLTLPTAVGNTNTYTVKNGSSVNISVASTSSQTFDGSASPITLIPNQSLTFVSDGTNWKIT